MAEAAIPHCECERMARAETKLKDFEGWQKAQNGSIQEVAKQSRLTNKRIDKLMLAIFGLLGIGVINLLVLVITLLRSVIK